MKIIFAIFALAALVGAFCLTSPAPVAWVDTPCIVGVVCCAAFTAIGTRGQRLAEIARARSLAGGIPVIRSARQGAWAGGLTLTLLGAMQALEGAARLRDVQGPVFFVVFLPLFYSAVAELVVLGPLLSGQSATSVRD